MRTGSLLATSVLTLLLAGCAEESPEATPGDDPSTTPTTAPTGPPWPEYAAADYTFVLRVGCFCVDGNKPYVVTVVGGEATEVVEKATGKPGEDYRLMSINDIIAAVNEPADQVDVTWHDGAGYPAKVYIDRDQNMADEEVTYTIRDVQPTS